MTEAAAITTSTVATTPKQQQEDLVILIDGARSVPPSSSSAPPAVVAATAAATASVCSEEEASVTSHDREGGSKKKRSISVDHPIDGQHVDYGALSKKALVDVVKERDARISALLEKEPKRPKTAIATATTTTLTPTKLASYEGFVTDADAAAPATEVVASSSGPAKSSNNSTKAKTSALATAASDAPTTATSAAAPISPEKVQAKVEQVRRLVFHGILPQIKWRPSCQNGTARFSYTTGACDEATFRAFLQLTDADKTKGGKYPARVFQDRFLGNYVMVRVRDGYLSLNGDVNVTYNKGTGEVKITGAYGI
jgi:hypothetical protein